MIVIITSSVCFINFRRIYSRAHALVFLCLLLSLFCHAPVSFTIHRFVSSGYVPKTEINSNSLSRTRSVFFMRIFVAAARSSLHFASGL